MRAFTKNRRLMVLIAVMVPLLLLFLWVAFRSGPFAPVRVTVATVEERAIAPALFGIGTVEARFAQFVGPTAAGRVTHIHVDVGDVVQPGQLLAQIDPIDLDQRIEAATGSSARSSALERAAAAQVADAEARVQLARSEASRAEELFRNGWVTKAMIEQRRQALTAAHAALANASANRSAAAQDRNRAGAERAALIEQKANLHLVAPRAGLVVRRLAEPGTTVLAGQAVIEIVDPDQLWISARFDQTRSGGLIAGLKASVVLRSRPDQPLSGSVMRVEPMADAVTEEILAKVGLGAINPLPPIGELAEVTLSLPNRPSQPTVPNAAIHRVDGINGVWLIRNGDLVFVPVTLGIEDAQGRVQILKGLAKGDRVVVHSASVLSTRSRIEIVDRVP